jgi:hypothetical protein
VSEYGVTFSNTYKRSAHIALEKVLTHMEGAGLKPGDQVEAEVLYGEVPNVVPYSADTSYIIFLRTTEGTVNIDRLKQKLDGHSLNISIMTPYTPDGVRIFTRPEEHKWKFSRTPVIPNTIPTYVSRLRDPVEVKNVILEKFVRQIPSAFGPEDGWIEGIVLANPITGHRFKVVDKDVFLAEKKFQWAHRDAIMEYPRSPKYVNSIFGRMLVRMADYLGNEALGTIQAKRYLRNLGSNTTERISMLMEDKKISHVAANWGWAISSARIELNRELGKYEAEILTPRHGLSENSIKRTRETFATLFNHLDQLEKDIKSAKNMEELILVFLGKQLKDIEGEE